MYSEGAVSLIQADIDEIVNGIIHDYRDTVHLGAAVAITDAIRSCIRTCWMCEGRCIVNAQVMPVGVTPFALPIVMIDCPECQGRGFAS